MNMNEDLLNRLAAAPVVPLVVPDDPETAIKTTQALVAGGLTVIEVVLRTSSAVECLGDDGAAVELREFPVTEAAYGLQEIMRLLLRETRGRYRQGDGNGSRDTNRCYLQFEAPFFRCRLELGCPRYRRRRYFSCC